METVEPPSGFADARRSGADEAAGLVLSRGIGFEVGREQSV